MMKTEWRSNIVGRAAIKTKLKRNGFKVGRAFYGFDCCVCQKGNRFYRFRFWSTPPRAFCMIMVNDIQNLLDDYTRWLRDKTVLREVGSDWVQITTPHIDRHNDCLQFYVRREGNGYLLTDDGYIINDLINSGCPLDSPKRENLLRTTLAGFGVQTDGEQLLMKATQENFSLKKHNFIQAMLAVNDL